MLFADDLKIFTNSDNENSLQLALDNIYEWSVSEQLPINLDKTVTFKVGKRKTSREFTLGNRKLKIVESIRDLGVILNSNLDFSDHISKIVKNAFYKAIQIIKLIRSRNYQHWLNIYKVYVRPVLEFALEILSPIDEKSINQLERVQKFYTRMIYKKLKIPYKPYALR